MSERWLPIPGFSDYRISSYGNIWNSKYERPVQPFPHPVKGYLLVKLSREGNGYQKYLARLVAEGFHEAWRPGIQIGFLDDNIANCRSDNLYIRGEKIRYYREQPLRVTGRRIRIIETDQVFRSVHKCAVYINGYTSAIYKVLRGQQHSHLGYTFEWVQTEEALFLARKNRLL